MENEFRHAQVVMHELGVTAQYATPQSVTDSWYFWNCENLPDPLPPYLTVMEVDPMRFIGLGLSEKIAKEIRDYKGNVLK
jgi:hypothetical protein